MENGDKDLKLDIKKICRTCMTEGEMTDLYRNCDKPSCILERVMSCTFLQILPNDGLPSQICSKCLIQVNIAYSFAKICEETDKKLRYYLKNGTIPKDTCKQTNNSPEKPVEIIKISPVNDVSQDDDIVNISEDSYEINFDPSVYTDHTYDKKSSDLVFKPKITVVNIETIKNGETNKKSDSSIEKLQLPTVKTKTGPPYVCKRCDEKFPVYHQLKEHYKTANHTRQDYYKYRACPVCKKVISFSHLNHHLKTHTMEKPYCCEVCGKRFSLSGNLTRHKRVHSGEKPFKCEFCGKCFSQSTTMKDHRRIHTKELAYICSVCGKTFMQISNFNTHMKRHETGTFVEGSEFVKDGRSRRRKKATENLNLQCKICNQIFRSAGSLKTHHITHEEKKFNCSECWRGFADLARLQSHLKSHSLNRPFSCQICGKAFTMKSSLKSHMFIHTGEKPFPCDYCEKAFVQLGQLRYHLRVHTGERPYKCSVCGKSFALNGNLTVHMRTHTGETPYVCPVCNKGYYDSSSMKKHFRTHETEIILG